MPGKKHPILIVLAIVCIIGVILGSGLVFILKVFFPSDSGISLANKISVIPIEGPISNAKSITSQLVKYKKDSKIKAIILRINSPGGAVGPTQEIFKEIRRTRKAKKVVASMGGVAASGGYYIAAAADKIVANPGTVTGSIGVVMQYVVFEELMKKIGVRFEVLKSGEFKDMGSPHRELTERERELFNALILDIKGQFVESVAESRDLPIEKVLEIADGRIFTGKKAKELGLVDILGNFQDAIETAKTLAGIKGDVTLVYPRRKRMGLLDLFLGSLSKVLMDLMRNNNSQLEYKWNGLPGQTSIESY